MSEYFSFKLVTPEKIYLEGQAELITVPGVEGDIGFLAQHTNFITSIRPGIIKVIRDDNTNVQFYVDGGFVKFSDNELLLVAEEVADEDDINTEFISKKIVKPLKKRYCQGTDCASSIKRTTKAPKDQNIPAIKTIKIAESTVPFFILSYFLFRS